MISALTTTGFSTVQYNNWPSFALLVCIVLMMIGGGIGSTAGGIKMSRVYIMLKTFAWNLKKKFMPQRCKNELVLNYPAGKIHIDDDVFSETSNYFFLYFFLFFIGVGILTACGYSITDSMFEFASALSTVGLSIGVTSTTTHPVAMWTMSIGMLIGRLEILVVFTAIIKICKDGKKFISHKKGINK